MNEYEITYLTSPSLSEDDRGVVDVAVDSVIDQLKGSISGNSTPTRRRLAYPIQKQSLGFLRTVQASLDPSKINNLREQLKKTKGLIRFSILQTAHREEVSPSILDRAKKEQATVTAKTASDKDKEPAKEISMSEVESQIEKALDEEVK
jgi:ribosomal protein S6